MKFLVWTHRLLLLFCVFAVISSFGATPVQAQNGTNPGYTQEWTPGLCVMTRRSTTDPSDTYQVATIQGIQCLIANVLSVALTIIGLGGFIMIVVAAFKYLLSGGNTKGTESARNTITFAVIGLVLALSSIAIINVLAAFTGVDQLKTFIIPTHIEDLI